MTYDLKVERMIDARPDVVFEAFVDPEAQKSLYGGGEELAWVVGSGSISGSEARGRSSSARRARSLPGNERLHRDRPSPPDRFRVDDGHGGSMGDAGVVGISARASW